jgi:hypothetical protein
MEQDMALKSGSIQLPKKVNVMVKYNATSTPIPSYPNWRMPTWLPDDELITVNGLSADMRKWLDVKFMNEEGSRPIPDYHEANELAYRSFVRRYSLKGSGYADYCQHAIVREKTCTPTQRGKLHNDCESIGRRYRIDHFDMFVIGSVDRRKKSIDVIVGQPYRGDISGRIEELAEKAVADGLELLVSARQSYHLPGYTALIAIARPEALVL